ncbi:hypothetical protein A9Q95_11725 [Rhodobacterales bacterium 59_46_T64]|nr:hypothetical protein A9Q95_11725 [Rhodobacterales bacterium 59_46_T64]
MPARRWPKGRKRLRFAGIIDEAIARQRGALFGWVPVCFALGIGGYFLFAREPAVGHYLLALSAVAVGALGATVQYRRTARSGQGAAVGALCMALALGAAGFCSAGLRAHVVASPVMDWRYYGPIEGKISDIDRSSSGAMRLTLAQAVLRNLPPDRTPARIRVTLHGPAPQFAPKVGQTILTTGHLSAAPGPTEPEGFDFRRHAWFRSLGAVGYTRNPVVLLAPSEGWQNVTALRLAISARVRARLPGEAGGFAAAIMTGDRAAMPEPTLTDLRRSNLAHLLAISGLHMGLLAGVLLGAARLGLCLVPWLALRVPVKKCAAVIALTGAAGYLALSGGNIATERAFVMVAVALVAVMVERRALSLRAVALAALVILALRPEGLTEPGFQMSFAATTALVAVFAALRGRAGAVPRWVSVPVAVFISSAVAGLATAPFSAAHFNQVSYFGLLANLVSVPLMGAVVMPAAVAAAALMPFGLEAPALWVMGLGLRWILMVAHWVAGLDGAVGQIAAPPAAVLPLLALGGLFVVLWKGRARVMGIVPMLIALAIWNMAARPAVLIARDGALVGVMTAQGRALSRAQVAGFTAQNWLENDGDAQDQQAAAARWQGQENGGALQVAGLRIRHLRSKAQVTGFTGCGAGEIVVMNRNPERALPVPTAARPPITPAAQPPKPATLLMPLTAGTLFTAQSPCLILTPKMLSASGAVAFYQNEAGLKMLTAGSRIGARLWRPPPPLPKVTPLHQKGKTARTARLDP